MTIVLALLKILESFEDPEFTPEMRTKLRVQINSASPSLTLNPREQTEGNGKILNAMLALALGQAQQMYGVGDDTRLHPMPLFLDQPQSQIVPLKDDLGRVVLGLGTYARSWEEVFYDVCHESLHLLNPVINVRVNKVCALEEGCAVKFAEQMYKKYISPYCPKISPTSPVAATDTQYFLAYSAATKIPNEVLRRIKETFGTFSSIDDREKFAELTQKYLTKEEIEILIMPFLYK